MTGRPNRKVVLGATGLLALGGAGGAVAATQSGAGAGAGAGRRAVVDDAAKRLNVSPTQLSSALTAAIDDRIAAEVAAGRLTEAQATKLKARVARTDGISVIGQGHRGGFAGRLRFAAEYLGVSDSALRGELQAGKSLAEVAAATPSKSAAGLKDALVTAAKQRLDQAVSMGWMTSAQEQTRLDKLGPRIDKLIARQGLPPSHGLRTP